MSAICRFYGTASGCRYGDRCRYQHIGDAPRTTNNKMPCHFFSANGGCRNGQRCRFSHEQPSDTPMSSSSTDNDSTSENAAVAAVDRKKAAKDESKLVAVYDKEDRSEAVYNPRTLRNKARIRTMGETPDKATCSVCNEHLASESNLISIRNALTAHYVIMLGKPDQKHIRLFREHKGLCDEPALCEICGSPFSRPVDLFRHLKDKSRSTRNPTESQKHKTFFEEIVAPFVERDTGMEITEEDIVEEIRELIGCDSESGGLGDLMFRFGLLNALSRMDGGSDSDDDSDGGMFGFSSGEVEELLCQGVKPWDDDAHAVLAVLNGDYDDYY